MNQGSSSKPAGRTVPENGCKRPEQSYFWVAKCPRDNQERSWAICSCWSPSAPLDSHVSSKLSSMWGQLTPASLGTLRLHQRTKQSLLTRPRQPWGMRKGHPASVWQCSITNPHWPLHSLWQAAFSEQGWRWLSEGGWCSPSRAVGSPPVTERLSVWQSWATQQVTRWRPT